MPNTFVLRAPGGAYAVPLARPRGGYPRYEIRDRDGRPYGALRWLSSVGEYYWDPDPDDAREQEPSWLYSASLLSDLVVLIHAATTAGRAMATGRRVRRQVGSCDHPAPPSV